MNYSDAANILAERKAKLGMSEAYIARRSGVSQSVVHRILSGKHSRAVFKDFLAIAKVLGLKETRVPNGFDLRWQSIPSILEDRAELLATVQAALVQGTSGLEGQAVSHQEQERLFLEYKSKLLAGPKKDLWSAED